MTSAESHDFVGIKHPYIICLQIRSPQHCFKTQHLCSSTCRLQATRYTILKVFPCSRQIPGHPEVDTKMASSTERLIIVTIVTCFLMGLGSSLHMEVSHNPFNGLIHKSLDISCIVGLASASRQDVVVIQIQRPNQQPIVLMDGKRGLTMGPHTTSRTQAEGHIDIKDMSSYVKITISHPGPEDAGIYQCSMFYMNKLYQLKEERAQVNITMDNEDIGSIVAFFLEKTAALETANKKQQTEIEHLKTENTKQEQVLKEGDRDNTAILSDLQNTVTVLNGTVSHLGKYVTQQMEKDTTQCAFSIGYNTANTLVDGQILKFTDPITNIGHHYNTDTGIFTAPRDGVYVFHLVVMSCTARDGISIELQHNSDANTVAGVYAQDEAHVDQSSVSIVLSLVQGDTVYPRVKSFGGTDHMWSSPYSIFSGFILKAS